MKVKKSDFILRSIIETYLDAQNPVGSLFLQDVLHVPASTIRVYFKQLDDLGLLSKSHASSGRIPTVLAMKNYWYEKIMDLKLSTRFFRVLDDSAFSKLIEEMNLFCMLIDERESALEDIINIKNKYLFLEFSDFTVVLPYDASLFGLFKELLQCDVIGVLKVLDRLKLCQEKLKIISGLSNQKCFIYGKERFYQMSKLAPVDELTNISLLGYFENDFENRGLLKPEFLGFKIPCKYHNIPVSAVICGPVYENYERLLLSLKEVI